MNIVVPIDFIAILLTLGIFLIQIVNTNMYLIHYHSKNIIKIHFPKSWVFKVKMSLTQNEFTQNQLTSILTTNSLKYGVQVFYSKIKKNKPHALIYIYIYIFLYIKLCHFVNAMQ